MAPNLHSSFWARVGLDEGCRKECMEAVRTFYENQDADENWERGVEVREYEEQGYCSFTILVERRLGDGWEMSTGREGEGEGLGCTWATSTSDTSSDLSSIPEIETPISSTPSSASNSTSTVPSISTSTSPISSPSISGAGSRSPSLVQIRPPQHALDPDIAAAARDTYGELVPWMRELDIELPGELRAVEMEILPGVSGGRFLSSLGKVDMWEDEDEEWERRVNLVKAFAGFVGRGWVRRMEAEKEGGGKGMELGLEELGGWGEGEEECERDGEIVKGEQQRIFRADSPLEGLELEMEKDSTVHLTSEPISESPEFESDPADTGEHTQHRPPRKNIPLPKNMSQCHGRIASTLLPRLTQLTLQLPTSDLRLRASSTLSRIESLTQTPYSGSCPIVLTHGDLIPSNLLLSPQTWDIVGVVDWAEAEYLPFGICLYGLEFVLGSISTSDPSPHFLPTSASDHDPRPWTPTFVYHPRAPELRRVFLQSLGELVPHLGREEVREEVGIWRDVGVLLWFGFAWDEGRIDRVVEVGRDGVEVECLGAFLGVDWVADEEV